MVLVTVVPYLLVMCNVLTVRGVVYPSHHFMEGAKAPIFFRYLRLEKIVHFGQHHQIRGSCPFVTDFGLCAA